jgi:hypothetical protein
VAPALFQEAQRPLAASLALENSEQQKQNIRSYTASRSIKQHQHTLFPLAPLDTIAHLELHLSQVILGQLSEQIARGDLVFNQGLQPVFKAEVAQQLAQFILHGTQKLRYEELKNNKHRSL